MKEDGVPRDLPQEEETPATRERRGTPPGEATGREVPGPELRAPGMCSRSGPC